MIKAQNIDLKSMAILGASLKTLYSILYSCLFYANNHVSNSFAFIDKMTLWRNAGLTYLRYSQLAAAVTRKCGKVCDAWKDILSKQFKFRRRVQRLLPGSLKLTTWKGGKAQKIDKFEPKEELISPVV